MPLDIGFLPDSVVRNRADRGRSNHLAGQAAEDSVARVYADRGATLAHRRWRGRAGEVDLILREDDRVVLVEVKSAPDFDRAIGHVGPRQIARIFRAAEEFVGTEPRGSLTDLRIDLALVDRSGAVRIVENAFA